MLDLELNILVALCFFHPCLSQPLPVPPLCFLREALRVIEEHICDSVRCVDRASNTCAPGLAYLQGAFACAHVHVCCFGVTCALGCVMAYGRTN